MTGVPTVHPTPDGWRVATADGGPSEKRRTQFLRELVDNERAEAACDSVLVPWRQVAELDAYEQKTLGCPPRYPLSIYVWVDGQLSRLDMSFRLEYREHRDGTTLNFERVGCALLSERRPRYLLSSAEYALAEEIERANRGEHGSRDHAANLLAFARVKELVEAAQVEAHEYVDGEDVIAPERLLLEPREREDGVLELAPKLEGLTDAQQSRFLSRFDAGGRVQGIYTVSDDQGKRTRIPLSSELQGQLREAKRYRRTRGDAKEELTANPERVFDPDIVDLDAYSKRVVELGLHKPRYIPFLSPHKSEWLPGILIEDGDERRKVSVRTGTDREELSRVIEVARAAGDEKVSYQGALLPVGVADELLTRACTVDQPTDTDAGNRDHIQDRRVLVIRENIDDEEYVDFQEGRRNEAEFVHRFESPPRLRTHVRLLEHQREGIAWLQSLFADGFSGALLADDMGLGKTLQALSFVDWHDAFHNPRRRPYLVVAPTILLENWQAEHGKFFDGSPLDIVTVRGEGASDSVDFDALGPDRLVLTTYTTLRMRQLELCRVDWAAVILDEAHHIKTPSTLVTNAAKALKSSFAIAMTGTPVENALTDLWCIVDFVAAGLLGSLKDFVKEYQTPLKHEGTDIAALGEKARGRVGVHLKRRMKADHLPDLPDRHEHRYPREMPGAQAERYADVVGAYRHGRATSEMLTAIAHLRLVSDHPDLLDHPGALHDTPPGVWIERSAKLAAAIEIANRARGVEEKVIFFADRKLTQRMLAYVLSDTYGLDVSVVNGDTSASRARHAAIDRFQAARGFNAIVMAPRAAGVGLNITEANHVVHYARDWNPAKEDQASDRVYRIGQTRPVHIHYPMAVSERYRTVDVVLDELLARKRELAAGILFPTLQADIQVADVFEDAFASQEASGRETGLSIDAIDRLSPAHFEAFIGALFSKLGYDTEVTSYTGDSGADVVACREDVGVLIQAKHTTVANAVSVSAVQEVVAAKPLYERRFGRDLQPAVVTNGRYTSAALRLANANDVVLHDRVEMESWVAAHPVAFSDVLRADDDRMARV